MNVLSAITGELVRHERALTPEVLRHRHSNGSALSAAADWVTLRAIRQRQATTAWAALESFVAALYEVERGVFMNVRTDGMVLIRTPWSKGHQAKYGLSDRHGRTLRTIMEKYSRGRPSQVLLAYEVDSRRWYLNLAHFSRWSDADRWLEAHKITAAEWVTSWPGRK